MAWRTVMTGRTGSCGASSCGTTAGLSLVNDDEHGGCLIPMMMLYHEHDEEPEMRPEPVSPEQREEVIAYMAAGPVRAYRYFREHRQISASAHTSEPRRSSISVARNYENVFTSGAVSRRKNEARLSRKLSRHD
jgi:hypothetical protein